MLYLAAALSALATASTAADLDAMSRQQKKSYCIAYAFLDLETLKSTEQITEEQYKRMRIQLAWKVQDKGDNYNYAGDYRAVDAAINAILAGKPTVEDVSTQAATCRTYLRL